jgi:superfamily II DNA or RNA helicase
MWGGRVWREPPSYPTLVVATIQTLAQRVAQPAFARHLAQLGGRAAAVVFDEAHHVVAPSYGRVLRALGLSADPNALGATEDNGPPLFGLTATPARRRQDETEQLAERFHGRLLEPADPYRSMAGYIRRGYLARPHLVVVRTGYVLDCLQEEDEEWRESGRLPEGTLERAGHDPARTAVILRDLEPRLADLRSVLVFACSVEHAETMAEALSRRGQRAAALHGRSSHAYRQSVLRRFRERALTVLVSCDLLTTGFDAPNVDAVVLARPLESPVLFAQMVGRGLRGPRNGGTPECLLLDYEDNLGPFGSLEGLRASFRAGFVGEEG